MPSPPTRSRYGCAVVMSEGGTTEAVDRGHRLTAFGAAAAFFVGFVLITTYLAAHKNGGHFTYPLDDVYIHLSMARNLALHGTWGVVPGVYSSASSSPLWTLLLALPIRIVPSWAPVYPMALATLVGLGFLWWLSGILTARRIGSRTGAAVVMIAIVLAAGLVPMAVSGMEALLHGALIAVTLVLLGRAIDRGLSRKERAWLAVVLAVAAITRFETLFVGAALLAALVVVPPVGGWDGSWLGHVWRRRRNDLLTVFFAVAVPTGIFAIVNEAFGEYLLPNSVIGKSSPQYGLFGRYTHSKGWTDLLGRIMVDPELMVLAAVAGAVAYLAYRSRRRGLAAATGAYLAIVGMHVLFDTVGVLNVYFARYDTYLVVSGVALVAWAITEVEIPWRTMVAGAAAVVLLIAATPRVRLAITTPAQGHEIYRQQLQTARFLERFYDGKTVAVNDLGETSLHHRGDILDLTGLASFDVLKAKRNGTYSADFLQQQVVSNHVQVIAVYPSWFYGTLPDGDPQGYVPLVWVPVEEWCLVEPDFKVVGDRCVLFFAPDAKHVKQLKKNLDAFVPTLPVGVVAVPPFTPLPGLPIQPPPPA